MDEFGNPMGTHEITDTEKIMDMARTAVSQLKSVMPKGASRISGELAALYIRLIELETVRLGVERDKKEKEIIAAAQRISDKANALLHSSY